MSLWGICKFTVENSLCWYLLVSLEDRGGRWDQQGLESPRREAAALEGFSQPPQCHMQRTQKYVGRAYVSHCLSKKSLCKIVYFMLLQCLHTYSCSCRLQNNDLQVLGINTCECN